MPEARPKRPSASAPPRKEGGFLWNFLGVASIIVFVGAALTSWRESVPVTYHYMAKSTPATQNVHATQYGLYMISYNGGAVVKNWNRLQMQICVAIDSLAPINQGIDILTDVACGSTCIGHFRTRCQVYTKLQFWGYVTLGALIVTGCLGVAAGGWVFMFGPNRVILQLLWTGGSIAALGASAFWIMTSNDGFNALQADSQFPYPSLSTAAYVAITGLFMLLSCGLTALLLAYLADRAEWQEKQRAIQEKILQESGFGADPFSLPPGALGGAGLSPYQFQQPGGASPSRRGLPPVPPGVPPLPPGRGSPVPPGAWPPGVRPSGASSVVPSPPGLPPPPIPPPGHPAAARRGRY